jgi:hypothetical protein
MAFDRALALPSGSEAEFDLLNITVEIYVTRQQPGHVYIHAQARQDLDLVHGPTQTQAN